MDVQGNFIRPHDVYMHMKGILLRAFALWLPLAIALSGVFVFAYWAVQQNYRQQANDPQVQLAEDGAARLNGGGVPAELVPRGVPPTDIATSLAPWTVVYDSAGKPLESSAVLDNAPPQLPLSAFDATTWKKRYAEYGIGMSIPSGETRFSWQPRPDVRQAVVLVQAKNGYFVAVGRNLREVENRERTLSEGWFLSWFGSIAALYAALAFSIALL